MKKKIKRSKVKWEIIKYKSTRHSKNVNAVLLPDGNVIFIKSTKAGK